MARERWLAGAYELTKGSTMDVEYRNGLYATPAVRSSKQFFTGVTGERWTPRVHGPGSFAIKLWWGPRTGQTAAWDQFEEVLRACARPHTLTRYTRHLADSTVRYCDGEVLDAIEPQAIGQGGYRATLEVGVPDGYWFGVDTVTQAITLTMPAAGQPFSQVASLTSFQKATAPLERLTYRVDGGTTGLRLRAYTDDVARGGITYAGTVGNTQAIIFNSDTWQTTGVGLTPNQAAVTYTQARYLSVPAAAPGASPKVILDGTYGGGTVQLTASGRIPFLC